MRIYLADLGHNLVTATSDTYPLGVANLAVYAREYVITDQPLDISIYRDPQELKGAIDANAPDVIGFASYSWNHRLAVSFATYLKARHPKVLTLMGGPNFPLTVDEQASWMKTMPQIDIHVRGPTYEGERAFQAVIQRFVDAGGRREAMFDEPIPGSHFVHPATGTIVRGSELPRIRELDEIPSPYLAGYMDKFFDTGLFALMQLARGCPFTCTFCNSAVKSNSKVFRHSFERTKADLDYIVERIDHSSPLCFADDNFGMYVQDEEVADYLGDLMDRYDWPNYIRTTTGKNRGDRIINVMRKARGRLPMTSSVQSLSPIVLKNIRRDNISLDTYTQVQAELHAQGMQSYGELILCMPGETKESLMDAVDKLIETGVSRVAAHQLMLLHGAPLADPESREQFGFKTRHRIVARCLGKYGTGETVVETEEMVVESENFSFQDYLDTRAFHLLLTIFYYEDNFAEAFRFAREKGIRPFQVVRRMQEILHKAPAAFQQAIDDYLAENQAELFDTREDCVAWSRENYDGLISGELGGNLLSKYAMIGRFIVVSEALEFLQQTLAELIGQDVVGSEMLAAIIDYYRSVMLHVPFRQTLSEAPRWNTSYDIEAWRAADYTRPLSDFRFGDRRELATQVDPRVKSVLLSRLESFGEHPSGLGRFTRTMFATDFRRKVVGDDTQTVH